MSATDGQHILPWLQKVRNDLLNIANNLRATGIPWDTVCFHAQQAAEKAPKACLVAHGIDPPHIHVGRPVRPRSAAGPA